MFYTKNLYKPHGTKTLFILEEVGGEMRMSFRPKQFQTTRVIDSLIRSDYKQERTITKTKGGKKEQQTKRRLQTQIMQTPHLRVRLLFSYNQFYYLLCAVTTVMCSLLCEQYLLQQQINLNWWVFII
jgi:hypothetical protein